MKMNIIAFAVLVFFSCNADQAPEGNSVFYNEKGEMKSSEWLIQGIPVFEKSEVLYNKDGKGILKVKLSEPVIIDSADKEQKWGFFQFPSLGRTLTGELVAEWNMAEDAASAYGLGGRGRSYSTDGGKTWKKYDKDVQPAFGVQLKNGDLIKIYTPKAIDAAELKLPAKIDSTGENTGRKFGYYKLDELPANLQGVYFDRMPKGQNQWIREHAKLIDPDAARYTDGNLFPVVWWGDIRTASDGALIAGIYPGLLIGPDNRVQPSGVFFYRSTDDGRTWNIHGRIPYVPDVTLDSNGLKRTLSGYAEPAFEILKDGSFICVMRTPDIIRNSPMHFSRSTDEGKTWTKPHAITKTGVMPRLLQLDNGVLVLASGRPGMQLRFSIDGKGEQWTDPFEMLPFDINNIHDAVTCGYPDIVPSGPNSFILIYSDFKFKNHRGETRKAIKVREIVVDPVQ